MRGRAEYEEQVASQSIIRKVLSVPQSQDQSVIRGESMTRYQFDGYF